MLERQVTGRQRNSMCKGPVFIEVRRLSDWRDQRRGKEPGLGAKK
jgi:hypothetical protein